MAGKKLVIPSFKSEKSEAAWWDRHGRQVEADLRAAMRAKKTTSLKELLGQSQRQQLVPVTLRLPDQDLAVARQLAGDKGVGYQTYIKLLLHEALRKEAARSHNAARPVLSGRLR